MQSPFDAAARMAPNQWAPLGREDTERFAQSIAGQYSGCLEVILIGNPVRTAVEGVAAAVSLEVVAGPAPHIGRRGRQE